MKSVGELTSSMFGKHTFVEVSGKCEEHGESVVSFIDFVKVKEWYCHACAERAQEEEKKKKWIEERAETLHRIACIPYKHQGGKFNATTKEQRLVRQTCKSFRDTITKGREWAVLALVGECGTGKTQLACELGESLITNCAMGVRYSTANQMISEIQSSYKKSDTSEDQEIDKFARYELLIIDEIDAKRDTENANLLLTEVVNRRYNLDLPIVVITNQPLNDLSKFVGDRVADRLHENAFVCSFTWPSFRRANLSKS